MKIAWTTGAEVADDVTHDAGVPLDDAAILAWAGAVDAALTAALARNGATVTALLGCLRHDRAALPYPDEARLALTRPDLFGLPDEAALDEVATAARTWLARAETAAEAARGERTIRVGGRRYLVEGRLAQGEGSDVLRARWDHPPGELVVLKIARTEAADDGLRREHSLLSVLRRSTVQGSAHFARLIPQPIGLDLAGERVVAAYQWRSGFQHTLADARRVHPHGIDPIVLAWVWTRVLELLGWVHRAGVRHGAVRPEHVLLHPHDHGATLVGWTLAGPAAGGTAGDLAGIAAAVAGLPPALETLRAEQVALDPTRTDVDAWEVAERLGVLVRGLGPPGHHPLPMPGW